MKHIVIDWLVVVWLFGWLVGWLVVCLFVWFIGWLGGWGWLIVAPAMSTIATSIKLNWIQPFDADFSRSEGHQPLIGGCDGDGNIHFFWGLVDVGPWLHFCLFVPVMDAAEYQV